MVQRCIGVALMLAGTLPAQNLAKLYSQVARQPLTQVVIVENVVFELHGFHFVLRRGRLALAAPVLGHVTAAVFDGDATLHVSPASATERAQIEVFRNTDSIDESFDAAVFRFADDAELLAALRDQVHFGPLTAEGPLGGLLEERAARMNKLGRPAAVRVLAALEDGPAAPGFHDLFYAELRGADVSAPASVMEWIEGYPPDWLALSYDPLAAAPARVQAYRMRAVYPLERLNLRRGQEVVWGKGVGDVGLPVEAPVANPYLYTAFEDTWTAFGGDGRVPAAPWRLDDYTLAPSRADRLMAATFTATAVAGSGRGLLLRLDSTMRVKSVAPATSTESEGREISFLQSPDPAELNDPSQYEGEWLYLRLPDVVPAGQTVRLSLAYSLPPTAALFPGPGYAWYPVNLPGPEYQPAHFRVAPVTVPLAGVSFAAVIRKVAPAQDAARQALPGPWQPVDLGGVKVPVNLLGGFADREDVFRQTAAALQFMSRDYGVYPLPSLTLVGTPVTSAFDPISAASPGRFAVFTPDDLSNVAARWPRIPGGYSFAPTREEPSWPGVITVGPREPPVAEEHHPTFYRPDTADQIYEMPIPHEVAHQWFGDMVGPAADTDAWLYEGPANQAALAFVVETGGAARGAATLARWRRELLQPDLFRQAPESLGPVSLGRGLDSSKDPEGWETLTYDKGGYILEMLRIMMRAGPPAGDSAFTTMLRDFLQANRYRAASVADFKSLAEARMTPAMDLDHNHRLDWFFQEYVDGTVVPTLDVDSTVVGDTTGASASVSIANPQGWCGLLPVDLYRDADHSVAMMVTVNGPRATAQAHTDFVPVKVLPNGQNEMLVTISSRIQVPEKESSHGKDDHRP